MNFPVLSLKNYFSQDPSRLPLLMAGNQPNPFPAWRARSPLNLTPPLHNLPQAFDKLLPKFDPADNIAVDDHLQSFYLTLEGLRARDDFKNPP